MSQLITEENAQRELPLDPYHDGLTCKEIEFAEYDMNGHTFDSCIFNLCTFTNADVSECIFQDCRFNNCRFLMCKMESTVWNNSIFISSRLTGMNFEETSGFSFYQEYEDCLLESCVFYNNTLKNMYFKKCMIRGSSFQNCPMQGISFVETQFQDTGFLGCNLEKADFRSASGYAIDPKANKLKNARFCLPAAASFLYYLGITVEDSF
jgi:uncharacterized protein YjbI with pentapeptide repeats